MNCYILLYMIHLLTFMFLNLQSKREKCKASRAANDLLHRMGRDSLSVWKGKFVSINLYSFGFIVYLLLKLI